MWPFYYVLQQKTENNRIRSEPRASNWLKLNKVPLNKDKTQLVIFHKKSKKFEKNYLSIKIDGHRILIVDNVKYLGRYLDKHLSWDI